jgi:putative intracellular protease/amidase
MNTRIKLAVFAFLFLAVAAAGAAALHPFGADDAPAASAEKHVWVCPPCHDDHDKVEYDKPGSCPVCGMPLVDKASLAKEEARMAAQMARTHDRKRALILVFPGVQIIDFTAPYEVLGQAGMDVSTVAEKAGLLTTNGGLKITPDFTLENAPASDVVVVPGGNVVETQQSAAVKAWLNARAEKADVVLSVCNGAFILAKSGLLDGKSATTFAPLIEGLRAAAPKTNVVSDKRFVDNGKVVTSAGLSSGIDGALHVVEKLYGRGRAQQVAVGLEYHWDPEGKWVRAQLADRFLRKLYRQAGDWDGDIVVHDGTRDAWEDRWRVKSAKPEDLLASVTGALGVSGRLVSGRLEWGFADEKGGKWRGTASAAPEANGDVLFTVRVERAGA